MRVKRLSLVNFGPYRGPHCVELGAGAYAVVARYDADPTLSNAAGKSSLFEAVDFALYGQHRHRTDDEAISDGEDLLVVELETDDGFVVNRTRKRGKPTKLTVGNAQSDALLLAKGDEAQLYVTRHLGLDYPDYVRTSRVEQRQVARFVLARPEERMETVSGWLDLGGLERAEEHVTQQAADLSAKLDVTREQLGKMEAHAKALDEGDAPDKLVAVDERYLEAADRELAASKAALALGDRQRETKRLLAERQALVDEGVALRGEVGGDTQRQATRDQLANELNEARATLAKFGAEYRVAAAAADRQREVARGEFDGRCPVAGIDCPARDQINADGTAQRKRLKVLESARERVHSVGDGWTTRVDELERALREHDGGTDRLQWLREQVQRVSERAKATFADGDTRSRDVQEERVLEAERTRATLAVAVESAKRRADQRERLDAMVAEYRQDVVDLERELRVRREAQQVLGKQGAQRRVAEPALARIRDDADALLADAGVDLRVVVEWSREGKQLAAACDQCGGAYPASRRVRECGRCGAARGQQLVNKLEVRPSRVSGGAEDLVGVAFQLAASAWLRSQRGARWSCALLDEPFAQCDEGNRRALARQLARLVGGRLLLEQALVVSHASDTNCFAGTVLVESDGKWARVRVL